MASRSLVIVDDFYEDADGVRATALGLAYPITGRFPGRNSANYDIEGSLRMVSRVLGAPVVVDARSRDIAFFRITRGSDIGACDIHVDPTGWAGVCYLNPNPPSNGGTSFFRHRVTGLSRWPAQGEAERLIADHAVGPSPDPKVDTLSHYFLCEGSVRDRWDTLFTIPMQYNRAVFYDARQFHSAADWHQFGESPETARLTALFFFDLKSR